MTFVAHCTCLTASRDWPSEEGTGAVDLKDAISHLLSSIFPLSSKVEVKRGTRHVVKCDAAYLSLAVQ